MVNFIPDAKKHFIVSMVKSILRIVGAIIAMAPGLDINARLTLFGMFIFFAEIVGVVEEMV
jgi:hypothetical protein